MAHAGRPLKYKTVEELEKIIRLYFRECDPHFIKETFYEYHEEKGKIDYSKPPTKQKQLVRTEQQPYTMAGLARRLGLSRQGLMEYKAKNEFSDTIKAARAKVEEFNERLLLSGKYATGAIFNLKVNFGYRENIEENPPPENPIQFINNVNVGDKED